MSALSEYSFAWSVARAVSIVIVASLIGIASLLVAMWLWWLPDPADEQRSRGVNALWAAHTWVGDEHTDAEYREFAELLEENEISDLFLHAGPFEPDGSVPPELIVHAPAALAALERYAPDVRVQAYLGQIEERAGGTLDLDDAAVRDGIIDTADMFLAMGFEGIHYDIEPIFPGDESFLELLERTQALTEPRNAVLSVALEQMEPARGGQRVLGLLFPAYHDPSADFLQDVAEHTDQVAIMTYDSGLPLDWLFGSYVAWQTKRVVEAIGDDATVFMGVPTYDEGSAGRFYSWAEHIETGVRGVRKGLDTLDDDDTRNVGIAVFAEWTTTADEWAAYREAWIRPELEVTR